MKWFIGISGSGTDAIAGCIRAESLESAQEIARKKAHDFEILFVAENLETVDDEYWKGVFQTHDFFIFMDGHP